MNERTRLRWFNTDAGFNKVPAQQLASNVRTFPIRLGNVRTHHARKVDLSLIKNTSVGNRRTLQFRAEALSAFNRVLLPEPNTTPTATAFGQIRSARRRRATTRAARRRW